MHRSLLQLPAGFASHVSPALMPEFRIEGYSIFSAKFLGSGAASWGPKRKPAAQTQIAYVPETVFIITVLPIDQTKQ